MARRRRATRRPPSASRQTASSSRASCATAATRRAHALDLAPVHQRPAGRHLRAEEQPDQADGRGRRRAIQARPRPARKAVRVRPLHGALRGGRQRGAHVHAPEGQGHRGSCPSTRAGTTARATRPTRTASRPTTSGRRSSRRAGLTDIIENYAQIVEEKDPKTGKKKRKQIFPRYHQLDVVRQAARRCAARTARAGAT